MELLLGSIFYTTLKTSREKVFCYQWNIFFSKFEITEWNGVISKEGLCLYCFHYFQYYSQNIFSRIMVLHLIAKVERKE